MSVRSGSIAVGGRELALTLDRRQGTITMLKHSHKTGRTVQVNVSAQPVARTADGSAALLAMVPAGANPTDHL